jgi:hypothetical protein
MVSFNGETAMIQNNITVKLMPSLINELIKAAELDEVELSQYVNIAVAEKLATRKAAKLFFEERAKQSSVNRALEILNQAGSEIELEPNNQDLLIFNKTIQ